MTDFSKPGTFTGKYDKFGSPVYVGDYIKCMISNGAEVKGLYGKVTSHISVKGNIFAVECEDPRLLEIYPLSDVFNISKRPDNITANLRVSSWSCLEPKRNRFFYDYPPEERIGRYSYFGVDNKGNKITLEIESKQNLGQNITIEIKEQI